jgi:hypothetical protein
MVWLSLRAGFANTAAIAALALLPFVSMASTLLKHDAPQTRVLNDLAAADRAPWQLDPVFANFVE